MILDEDKNKIINIYTRFSWSDVNNMSDNFNDYMNPPPRLNDVEHMSYEIYTNMFNGKTLYCVLLRNYNRYIHHFLYKQNENDEDLKIYEDLKDYNIAAFFKTLFDMTYKKSFKLTSKYDELIHQYCNTFLWFPYLNEKNLISDKFSYQWDSIYGYPLSIDVMQFNSIKLFNPKIKNKMMISYINKI